MPESRQASPVAGDRRRCCAACHEETADVVEPRAKRRQLSPEDKWQVLEVTSSQLLSPAEVAGEWRVDLIKLCRGLQGVGDIRAETSSLAHR